MSLNYFFLRGARNNVSHTRLHFYIEERVIEIVGPPRGRIVQHDFRRGLLALPGHGKP